MKFNVEVTNRSEHDTNSKRPSYKSLVSALRVIHYLSLSNSEESRKMTELLCRSVLQNSSKII